MKKFLRSRDGAFKGAALLITLALVVLLTGIALAYFSRTTTDRQLAHSSYNDTSADLLARSALDVIVGGLKQEIVNGGAVTRSNIQPQRSGDDASVPNLIRRSVRGDSIPAPGVSSLASAVSSGPADPTNVKRGEITSARWNSHYLIPRLNPANTAIDSTPVSTFTAPDWVFVTRNGPVAFSGWDNSLKDPATTNNNYVVGRYGFAIYDEGGLLDMNLAGSPANWPDPTCAAVPAPTPWLVNVGRKGILAFADLTALGMTESQVNNIVGWRNYAMTQRTGNNFGSFTFPAECNSDVPSHAKQDIYGSYLLYFGDPPFTVESLADKLAASIYPFTAVPNSVVNARTDQAFATRQQLLKLLGSVDSSGNWQNSLQYMGTFSRERNWPAPDWPNLNGTLSEGRFNLNNLALVVPNPGDCDIPSGKKKGWQTGKNRNHLCGTPNQIIELFGLFWRKAAVVNADYKHPGYWKYVNHVGPNPPGEPDPNPHSIICFRGANQQEDFFQVLHYALNVGRSEGGRRCAGPDRLPRTFGIGASLIDQYDSGADCITYPPANWGDTGCDLDKYVVTNNGGNLKYATHTTVIEYGNGSNGSSFAYGMEPNYKNPEPCPPCDLVNGDRPYDPNPSGNDPHRPQNAPNPIATTQVISHAFSNVGEFAYGIDTSTADVATLDFSSPNFYDAPVLDFFSYNPISSAYPRAGIVNLYTRNAPVLAAALASTWRTDAASANPNPAASPSGRVSVAQATGAANLIVQETQRVLAGTPLYGSVTPIDMTRAIAARLIAAGAAAPSWSGFTAEEKQSIARALAEVGQTRTWNLLIDVIAHTGHYSPNAQGLTDFIPEGEKRYWLHIALGRDLVCPDGTPYVFGSAGNSCPQSQATVDVLGTQLEEVVE